MISGAVTAPPLAAIDALLAAARCDVSDALSGFSHGLTAAARGYVDTDTALAAPFDTLSGQIPGTETPSTSTAGVSRGDGIEGIL